MINTFTRITITSPVVLLGSLVASLGSPGANVVTVVASLVSESSAQDRVHGRHAGLGPSKTWVAPYRRRSRPARAS